MAAYPEPNRVAVIILFERDFDPPADVMVFIVYSVGL
jgi:hypothetical protein